MAPLPSASPVGSLAPDQRPPGLPEGVNLYNFQMCQNAIIHMNVTGKMLLFDQPGPGSKPISIVDLIELTFYRLIDDKCSARMYGSR